MFESNRPLPSRKWTQAIGILVIAIPVVVSMYSHALISMLPFGIGKSVLDRALDDQLKNVYPDASGFSAKQETPLPHFIAYMGTRGPQTIVGYVFWTTELQPLERGYDGPIKILVGLDTNAKITGVLVTEHHEPYGYFSVEPLRFARQFRGKDIRDPFRVGSDIAAVSRASITINSAARAIL